MTSSLVGSEMCIRDRLFVDVSSAFTNASRLLLFGSSLPPVEWAPLLLQQGLSPETIQFICIELQEGGSLLSRAGVPPDIISLLGNYHEHVQLH
eukprot:8218256-Prorocentrum_lima.AAC.1